MNNSKFNKTIVNSFENIIKNAENAQELLFSENLNEKKLEAVHESIYELLELYKHIKNKSNKQNNLLKKAQQYLKEGHATFTPNVTNSHVLDLIEDIEKLNLQQ